MGPYKCPDCGIWWAGLEHRCRFDWGVGTGGNPVVVRPVAEPTMTGSTSSTPWCSICQGWHLPGFGPCTANWSGSLNREGQTLA